MECHFCKIFQESPSRLRQTIRRDEGKVTKLLSERFCHKVKTRVTSDMDSCDEFLLNNYFWCSEFNCRMKTTTCLHKQIKKKECQCLNGLSVLRISRRFKLEEDEDGNLIFVKKDVPQPIILRKRSNE